MQGTLNEIDISSILQLVELGQFTGELLVEAEPDSVFFPPEDHLDLRKGQKKEKATPRKPNWFLFFVNGQIAYGVSSNNFNLLRMGDYLRRYQSSDVLDDHKNIALASGNEQEYGYLWFLLKEHILTPHQARTIMENIVKETLFDLLSLYQGRFILKPALALTPLLTTIETSSAVQSTISQVQQWKQFHPQIQSPEQIPLIVEDAHLRSALKPGSYQKLANWIDGKTSLRQLSRYLNRDLLTLAKAIYPYVEKGWVKLSSTHLQPLLWVRDLNQKTTRNDRVRIVCVDDDVTTGKMVENLLTEEVYETITVNNSIQALSLVFQIKPNLILCDLAMPVLDGYEFCAMLRESSTFRHTPIITLTGKDSFMDRVKARMMGFNDYLVKPFGKNELLILLAKYLGR